MITVSILYSSVENTSHSFCAMVLGCLVADSDRKEPICLWKDGQKNVSGPRPLPYLAALTPNTIIQQMIMMMMLRLTLADPHVPPLSKKKKQENMCKKSTIKAEHFTERLHSCRIFRSNDRSAQMLLEQNGQQSPFGSQQIWISSNCSIVRPSSTIVTTSAAPASLVPQPDFVCRYVDNQKLCVSFDQNLPVRFHFFVGSKSEISDLQCSSTRKFRTRDTTSSYVSSTPSSSWKEWLGIAGQA
jgi:hypothetical protein